MKKSISLLLAICVCLSLGTLLAACNRSHVHHIDTEWTKNETHHWHECLTCDDVSGKAEHNWDNGRITQAATEEADGIITFVCYVCKQTTTEPLPYKADEESNGNNNSNNNSNNNEPNHNNGGENTETPNPENTVVTTVKDQAEWNSLFEIENCTVNCVVQIGTGDDNTGTVQLMLDGNRAITQMVHEDDSETMYSLIKDNVLYHGEMVDGKLSYWKASENTTSIDMRQLIGILIEDDFSKVTYDAEKNAYISVVQNETHEIYVENGKIVKILSTIAYSTAGSAVIEFVNYGTTVIESFPEFNVDNK